MWRVEKISSEKRTNPRMRSQHLLCAPGGLQEASPSWHCNSQLTLQHCEINKGSFKASFSIPASAWFSSLDDRAAPLSTQLLELSFQRWLENQQERFPSQERVLSMFQQGSNHAGTWLHLCVQSLNCLDQGVGLQEMCVLLPHEPWNHSLSSWVTPRSL